jgi:colanic acid biosynthesis glycosyl transferase WcaI
MLKPGLLTRVLYALERLNYRLVDKVSTISEGMRRKILGKGVPLEKTILFRNWANDDTVRPGDRMTPLRAEWGLAETDFVVLYSGNLGRKQGLDSLLDAAALLRDRPDVKIVIVGNGAEQPELVEKARTMSLSNVMFHPLQPIERLSELLATADVSVIPQKRAVTDIVLPSKLCNILASGRPVVAAAPPTSDLAMILRDGNCGILVEPEDGRQMAEGIRTLAADRARASTLAENGRRYAEANLLQSAVIGRFETDALADGR